MANSLGTRAPKHIGVYRERFQQRRILRSPEVRDQAVATFSKSKPLAVWTPTRLEGSAPSIGDLLCVL